MSMGPQYTSCVKPEDFTPLSTAIIVTLSGLIVVGGLTALFSFGIGALIAIASLVQLLRYVLDFMLNGKLICLHRSGANTCVCSTDGGTVCAIGEVADTEDVGEDKNPFEDVDNDYAMNVVLAPFSMPEFAKNGVRVGAEQITDALRAKNYDLATIGQPQGDLLQKQIPPPVKADGDFSGTGYYRTKVRWVMIGAADECWKHPPAT